MTTPAPFSRFLLAAVYGVGVVQVAVLAVIVLVKMGEMATGVRTDGLPGWLLSLDVVASLAAVVVMWGLYRRGDLDDVSVRRR